MKRLILLTGLILFTASTHAHAAFKASPWTQQTPYGEKISHKLGFGVLNIMTGWTAIFWEPSRPGNKFKGIGRGLLYAITNTAGGAVHAVTFPVPVDVPLPEGGLRYAS
jgi:hypothetical protein